MNRDLFQLIKAKVPAADAINSERAPAYAFSAKHALAQYAATGCLNATFYASAQNQLTHVLRLLDGVSPEFVAKTAVFARTKGFMKDLPALFTAWLTVTAPELAETVFSRVIDDAKMLRNFVEILRSGVVGRKSLGSLPKRLVRSWFDGRAPDAIFRGSVGDKPSLADVIRLAHPKPKGDERSALFAYLLGRSHDREKLPSLVRELEDWKVRREGAPPRVPFQLLTALDLDANAWKTIARNASWQETRMNLATFARHGVFASKKTTELVAARLKDPEEVRRARVFPYQLLMAHAAAGESVPGSVRQALESALDVALENVPKIDGKIFVCPDVSGSMCSPVTGHRTGATTAVRCIDVAGLVAAAMLRKNDAEVLPFEHDVVSLSLSKRDSVLTNARKLASVGGGGTSCSAPLAKLNASRAKGSLVVLVSDNESWVDARPQGTALMAEWTVFAARNPGAKLVNIDIVPNRTTQGAERHDVINVGGFSDSVFELMSNVVAEKSQSHWIDQIERLSVAT
ncbi:MAG: TROVE domain-containing protein [Deltaproteobacteria bacterium]|nr:TROVE domain-containing protein [Deltaproteobacteria bacterium]